MNARASELDICFSSRSVIPYVCETTDRFISVILYFAPGQQTAVVTVAGFLLSSLGCLPYFFFSLSGSEPIK